MAIIEKRKWKFKKGTIIHLDNFMEITAFVQVDGRTKPHQNKHIADRNYNPDMTDEHEVLKDFTVMIIVEENKAPE